MMSLKEVLMQNEDMTEAEANDTLKEYDRRFNTISKFMWQCRNELIQYGYVEDWFGKRYHIPVGQAYKAVNALVQGTCASLFKQALVQVSKILIPEKEHILLPIHDEIQIEVGPVHNTKIEKYFCKRVIDKMVNLKQTDDRDLALRVDVAKSTTNWSEKEKVEL